MNQLRVRTEFHFGETFSPIARVVKRLKALGATAAGIVDIGTWGHVPWDTALRKEDIQPMFGVQISVVPQLDSEDRPAMWFLAGSQAGLSELYRFSSLAQRQSRRGNPRLSYEDVLMMSDQIIKFCGAVLDQPLLIEARAYVDFDPSSDLLNRKKAAMARSCGLRTVVVSDNNYTAIEDRQVYEIIGRQGRLSPQHLLSEAELRAELKEAVDFDLAKRNMSEIIERCAGIKLPKAPMIRVEGDLEALCRQGIASRGLSWEPQYELRLRRELDMIRQKDFESYFLVVADMTRYAKSKMLVGPSRGSAAGSLVCYLAGITEIDPIPTNLIFERFIDITRADLPDIDLDFTDSKRELVLKYLRDKYGKDNVTQIGTINTFQPRSALIAVAKQLRVPPWETAAVKDSIFERSSGDSRANFALLDTLEQTEPGRKLLEKFPAMKLSAHLEAHATHCGVHAGGILVCNEPIESFCTVSADGVAQIDKKDAEKLNLLKIDVLGLRTLGVLEDSGIKVDWHKLPLDDKAVFDLLNKGRFAGIFQFEGPSLQSVASQMQINTIDDIGHVTALARPGPMASGGTTSFLLRRAGKESFQTPHPAFDRFVRDTYGVVMYQEQVLRICKELGDMTWEDTTDLRKAMSKSYGKEFFDKYRDKFIIGADKQKVDRETAIKIWEMVNTMGSYVFNLAHSYSYAVMSYWTAWLKAHHPLEFAAATLRNAKDDESAIKLLREMMRENVPYEPFDPELSEANWSVKNGKLYGGLKGIKGIGESKAAKLLELRKQNGGRLPDKERATLLSAEKTFGDVFPTERRFGEYYINPAKFNFIEGTKVVRINEIRGESEFVYLGRLVGKDLRDHNEEIRVKRRNGKRQNGPTLFLDLDIEDDTGKVLTRIERFDFETMGRPIWEAAPIGSWWVVRGKRKLWGRADGGFKMIYVDRIRQLPDPFRKESNV
jgi:DNA polymerase III alpha subunit